MSKLIINADDYGIDSEANEGILYCARNKLINSVSVSIVDDMHLQNIEELMNENVPLGLHINLTEGNCLTNGRPFAGPLDFINSQIDKDKILLEINLQIEKFKSILGYMPLHLDSHQYACYLTPNAFEALLDSSIEIEAPIRNPNLFTRKEKLQEFLDEVHHTHNIKIPINSESLASKNLEVLKNRNIDYRSDKILPHPNERQIQDASMSVEIYEIVTHPRMTREGQANTDIKLLESLFNISRIRNNIF